jgi:hypothetical protein
LAAETVRGPATVACPGELDSLGVMTCSSRMRDFLGCLSIVEA